jgi:hypothetical protein
MCESRCRQAQIADDPSQLSCTGGRRSSGSKGYGMVFELTPLAGGSGARTETVLYNLTGGSDGAYLGGGVAPGPNGVLYGTASQSGGRLTRVSCSS